MFDKVFSNKCKIDYWHITPIVLLIALALAIVYAFTRYSQTEELIYRKTFESQVFGRKKMLKIVWHICANKFLQRAIRL